MLNKALSCFPEAPNHFLETLMKLFPELSEKDLHKQTLLFIRICALRVDQSIYATKDLVKNALHTLALEVEDEAAAAGLLILSYENDISFKTFPIETLKHFELRYPTAFRRFATYLQGSVK